MGIDELFAVASTREPTWDEIAACCAELGGEPTSALNTIAMTLAERYDGGQINFETGDVIANVLHSWCLLTRDHLLPDPAYQVFIAFDEGEYHHSSDPRDVDPETKYTQPMIKEVLRGRNAV